ncbi:MAG: biopolymer transporter ExbD [Treponema sp.]|jgi:biopolymer transport protein ExbD|nr:biopolymer transporter ExbD [Treponema sp.]
MKLKHKEKPGFLESSASSDMAFLLIIYFLVIAGFNVNTGFLMNLPGKDSARLILKDDLIRFEIDGEGNIRHEAETISIGAAEKLISSARGANPNLAVMLSIDPQTQWQPIVSFVELVQDLKIDSFSFSMKKDAPL